MIIRVQLHSYSMVFCVHTFTMMKNVVKMNYRHFNPVAVIFLQTETRECKCVYAKPKNRHAKISERNNTHG